MYGKEFWRITLVCRSLLDEVPRDILAIMQYRMSHCCTPLESSVTSDENSSHLRSTRGQAEREMSARNVMFSDALSP